jgi:hypothetical protein
MEETTVRRCFFGARVNGTYVEIGGLDGFQYSNTLQLATCFGWSGTLIEGHPKNYAQLLRNAKWTGRSASGLTTHQGAVCEPSATTVSFSQVAGPIAGAVDQMSDEFKRRWHPEMAPTRVRNASATIDVPCGPMSRFLSHVRHIDFWSLDVEGSELVALRTVDWRAVTIDVVLIELDGTNPPRDANVRTFMRARGYSECVQPSGKMIARKQGLFVHERRADYRARCDAGPHENCKSFERTGVSAYPLVRTPLHDSLSEFN